MPQGVQGRAGTGLHLQHSPTHGLCVSTLHTLVGSYDSQTAAGIEVRMRAWKVSVDLQRAADRFMLKEAMCKVPSTSKAMALLTIRRCITEEAA